MSAISRQYHPPNCRLEITAQTSPLSRWAQRPIIKSVHFLLSFPGLSGRNHEPLEIRGDREQLQLLSETVADYVQHRLGQPLATAVITSQFAPASTIAVDQTQLTSHSEQPYLRARSLVTHDLILGSLTTNADQRSISLKASQLFDLVSALDDCTAELEMLPLPPRHSVLPVWASSAAVIVVMLGVTTATLQLTHQPPSTQQDWVTSSKQQNSSESPAAKADGGPSAPLSRVAPPSPDTTAQQPSLSPPVTPPLADAIDSLPQPLPEEGDDNSLPSGAKLPGQTPLSSPAPPQALAKAEPKVSPAPLTKIPPPSPNIPSGDIFSPPPQPSPESSGNLPQEGPPTLADQSTGQSAPMTPTAKSLQTPHRSSPGAVPPVTAESSLPETADARTEAEEFSASDQLRDRSLESRRQSHAQLEQSSLANATQAHVAALQVLELRQFMSQRWQVPVGLTQPLRYQLSFNANGSLKQVNPLDKAATQYLSQVPFPAANQPFITPFQSPQFPRIRLVLKPDGMVQTFVDVTAETAP